jgi:transcriptional regulator with XRE-family HTH domain
MGHDRRAGTKTPDEASLRELEDILIQAAEDGDLEILIGDELREMETEPVSAEIVARIRAGVQHQDQMRQKLSAARRALGADIRAFPDVLRAAREAAQATLADVAAALHTSAANVRRIESAEVDIQSLAPEFVAKVMELFTITCEQLAESVRYLIARRSKAAGLGALAARAPKAGARDLERALHDVAGMLAEEDGDISKTTVPEEFLAEVRRVLRRWGRDDLAG